MNYKRYKASMIYDVPGPTFTNDVVGQTGLGMKAEEYLSKFIIEGADRRMKGEGKLENVIEYSKEIILGK